jgi:hypothetical protein
MNATQTLPENYILAWDVNMKRDKRLNVILQVVGLAWAVLAGWLLVSIVRWMRPDFNDALRTGITGDILFLLLILVAMVVTIVFHELVHGLLFWFFARRRPEFGIGPGYAFAAMPDWYFPKQQYLVIGLGPLVGLTLLGMAIIVFAPLAWFGLVLIGMVTNAAGAIGDMYVCWRIAREAQDVWIKDIGDGFQVYRRRME